jgi:hypothetical protein
MLFFASSVVMMLIQLRRDCNQSARRQGKGLGGEASPPHMKVFCEDLARQNAVAHLSQLQRGFRRCRI